MNTTKANAGKKVKKETKNVGLLSLYTDQFNTRGNIKNRFVDIMRSERNGLNERMFRRNYSEPSINTMDNKIADLMYATNINLFDSFIKRAVFSGIASIITCTRDFVVSELHFDSQQLDYFNKNMIPSNFVYKYMDLYGFINFGGLFDDLLNNSSFIIMEIAKSEYGDKEDYRKNDFEIAREMAEAAIINKIILPVYDNTYCIIEDAISLGDYREMLDIHSKFYDFMTSTFTDFCISFKNLLSESINSYAECMIKESPDTTIALTKYSNFKSYSNGYVPMMFADDTRTRMDDEF